MINYALIAEAERFYQNYGYQLIDVPWIVSEQISNITLPPGKKAFRALNDFESVPYYYQTLVGSAEQAFMQMRWDGALENGRYVATSPCFRDESDSTHFSQFMKVELIEVRKQRANTHSDVLQMVDTALLFFRQYRDDIRVINTADGYDIVTNDDLELGSYGSRYHPHIGHWIYGTGLALPRFEM